MKFSVVVVCLNPGEQLNQTLDSILNQTFGDYEIVVKDGGSKDGSMEGMRCDERIRLYRESDKSIYDAMNQAVTYARGEFILFMNCGDMFYREDVLEKAAEIIAKQSHPEKLVLYGDTYGEKNRVCKEKPYDLQYRIRADYDHFLWCYYVAKADMVNLNLTIASYEGGGYSESKENRRRDKEEHGKITATYMGRGELLKYKLIMLGTLAPLRSFLAENKAFSGAYHRLKEMLYK